MVKNRSQILFIILLLCCVMLNGCAVDINHKHVLCQECGKCISESCDGLEEERCKGHEENHNHIPCQDCGKCIAEDCNGLEEEKCQGHQVIHEHNECQECGKCIAEDCNGLEEEKCHGCAIINLLEKKYISYLWEDDPSKGQDSIIINTFDEYISFVNKYCLMGFEYGEVCGLHYDDQYYSIINDYDESFFEYNSLIFIYVGFLHSRENPKIVHKVDYKDNELVVNLSVTFDSFSKDFRAGLFFNIEVSKYVIENHKSIKYIGNKIIILD